MATKTVNNANTTMTKCFLLINHRFLSSYRFTKGIRMAGIKYFIAGHHRDKIIRIRQVNDIMCPAGDHIDRLNLVSAYFKFHRLIGVNVALLDQSMTMHNDELFPLAVMPVLAFGVPGTPASKIPSPPNFFSRYFAPS